MRFIIFSATFLLATLGNAAPAPAPAPAPAANLAERQGSQPPCEVVLTFFGAAGAQYSTVVTVQGFNPTYFTLGNPLSISEIELFSPPCDSACVIYGSEGSVTSLEGEDGTFVAVGPPQPQVSGNCVFQGGA